MTRWDVFISYSSQDRPLADEVYKALQTAGLKGWVAFRELKAGRDYSEQIIHALENARVLLLVLTGHSNRSKHVLREVEYAAHRDLYLLVFVAEPVTLSSSLSYFLHNTQHLEAFDPGPPERYLPRLVTAAAALVGRDGGEEGSGGADGPPGEAGSDGGPRYGTFEVLRGDGGEGLAELGGSPLGTTFKARDLNTDQLVALKVIARRTLQVPGASMQLTARVERAARLRDVRLPALVGSGEVPSAYYAAWPFVPGDNLQSVVAREGRLEPAPALRIAWQIARALEAIGREGLIHGDLKPANILLTQRHADAAERRARPLIKLVDLRLTAGLEPVPEPHGSVGSGSRHTFTLDNPWFASPEKCAQETLDLRSDFYSLGALLWYLLTGAPLFGGTVLQAVTGHLSKPPPLESLTALPPELRRLLGWTLEKDPARRPGDAASLLRAIEAIGHSTLRPTDGSPRTVVGPGGPPAPDPSEDEGAQTLVSANRAAGLDGSMDGSIFASLVPDRPAAVTASVRRDPAQGEDRAVYEHYQVLRRPDGSLWELGRGAMGVTYKAFDNNLRATVALKIVNSDFLHDDTARQRFIREARAAASLRHPNVAGVFHLGETDGRFFYAMEFIDGESVEARVRRQGPLGPHQSMQIARRVASALGAAARLNLVHRDIKPANLMLVHEDDEVSDDGVDVKVIDFGLAKVEREGNDSEMASVTISGFVGTPHFASPEQMEEKPLDTRSDIYSLGATLWYMLTGRAPFSGSMVQIMAQHLNAMPSVEPLRTAHVPEGLIALLYRMLAKDPAQRPQLPSELRRELEGLLRDPAVAPPTEALAASAVPEFATVVPGTRVGVVSPATESPVANAAPPPIPSAPTPIPPPLPPAASTRPAPPPIPLHSAAPPPLVEPPGIAGPPDALTFTACTPGQVCAGHSFLLDIWAYTARQRPEMMECARSLGRAVETGRKGPVSVPRSTLLAVQLALDGLRTAAPVDTLLWNGEITNACFPVNAPADLPPGVYTGCATISAAGVPIAKLFLEVPVVRSADAAPARPRFHDSTARRTAFASYASADRDEVIARLQGMRKIDPELDVFVDVVALRSGQDWQRQIAAQAATRDVFYLFWSREAARSRWVDHEWRLAWQQRGLSYIDPVPLEDPTVAPPPEELRALHFNDSFLAYRKSASSPTNRGWLQRCATGVRDLFKPNPSAII